MNFVNLKLWKHDAVFFEDNRKLWIGNIATKRRNESICKYGRFTKQKQEKIRIDLYVIGSYNSHVFAVFLFVKQQYHNNYSNNNINNHDNVENNQ